MTARYCRQEMLREIGETGQRKVRAASVTLIGCGGLGGIIAECLVRSGIGRIRIVDGDLVELHNIHRQVLYNENDARERTPKALAAKKYLTGVNSEVEIEAITQYADSDNLEDLVTDSDLILDGLDNFKTRFLINDVALKSGIPWIYGGITGVYGMCMTIIPGVPPCFRCIQNQRITLESDITAPEGVIAPTPLIIGSLQAAQALKLLSGAEDISRDLIIADVWKPEFTVVKLEPDPVCPACHGIYEYLTGSSGLEGS